MLTYANDTRISKYFFFEALWVYLFFFRFIAERFALFQPQKSQKIPLPRFLKRLHDKLWIDQQQTSSEYHLEMLVENLNNNNVTRKPGYTKSVT